MWILETERLALRQLTWVKTGTTQCLYSTEREPAVETQHWDGACFRIAQRGVQLNAPRGFT
jgi:hypothetical protein